MILYLFDQHVVADIRCRHVAVILQEGGDPVTESREHLVGHGVTVVNLILSTQIKQDHTSHITSHTSHLNSRHRTTLCQNIFLTHGL